MHQKTKTSLKPKTLREHAEAWTKEQGLEVPLRGSKEYEIMYQKWIDYAFKDFPDVD